MPWGEYNIIMVLGHQGMQGGRRGPFGLPPYHVVAGGAQMNLIAFAWRTSILDFSKTFRLLSVLLTPLLGDLAPRAGVDLPLHPGAGVAG